jgi:hypothetical protein
MNSEELMHELELTLLSIDTQLAVMIDEALRNDITPHYMRNRDGTFAMVPLLTAKASVLSALVSLGKTDES